MTVSVGCRRLAAAVAATLLLGLSLRATPLGAGQDAAVPVLEYIAHASFVVQSSSGVRVAIDPFNSERWLGLAYPARVSADAVLVSHPHYDHDASYYFPTGTPVFRRPGRYAVGDIRIEGYEAATPAPSASTSVRSTPSGSSRPGCAPGSSGRQRSGAGRHAGGARPHRRAAGARRRAEAHPE